MERFEVLKEFRKTNASTGLHVMPIIPYITDNEENFESMFAHAAECGVHYVLPGTLYLRGTTYKNFMAFVEKEFADLYREFKKLYKNGGVDKAYKDTLR